MKCKNCLAANGEKVCLAGVRPYTLRCGEQGCCCNTTQVNKYMLEVATGGQEEKFSAKT